MVLSKHEYKNNRAKTVRKVYEEIEKLIKLAKRVSQCFHTARDETTFL